MTPGSRSATERRIKEVATLSRKKGRDQYRSYLIEGIRALESAFEAGVELLDVFALEDGKDNSRYDRFLKALSEKVFRVSTRDMKKMSDTSTAPGILGVARIPDPSTECILCQAKVLVLDGVQDPGNVGTLVRTASWFGVDAVIAGPGTADFYSPKTVRGAMGGIWDVILERVDFLEGFLETCRRGGADIRFADTAGTPISDWVAPSHSILVIGSEAHGVSEIVRTKAHGAISIASNPQKKAVESLNAAIAGGILMSHW